MSNENTPNITFDSELKSMIEDSEKRSVRLAMFIANSKPNDPTVTPIETLLTICEEQVYHFKMMLFTNSLNEVKEILNND